jgi:glycosyltransferase involved in cell wall biosynthesis
LAKAIRSAHGLAPTASAYGHKTVTRSPRVLMVSKALVVGIYQRKLEDIAQLGIDLTAVVPPSWRDERGVQPLERVYTAGYRLEVMPIRLNGWFHLHTYSGLGRLMREVRPDIVHIDEEPYNAAAWQAYRYAKQCGAKTVLFTWQNIARQYPPPFNWGERWVLDGLDAMIAGTNSAAEVWRQKGYNGGAHVIPQFGTDPVLFSPSSSRPDRPFTIGYFGRLVEEKGVMILLEAVAAIPGEWCLLLLGGGPLKSTLQERARRLGIGQRVAFAEHIPSTEMPAAYHRIDALALPSLTRPNWKEQFGRVLVEAMCSGVPVVGSSSGAIPDVVGDAGHIVPEGDAKALAHALTTLRDDPYAAQRLAALGRRRAETRFTHRAVAEATVGVYRSIVDFSF